MESPILLHIPHASPLIPEHERKLFCVSEEELRDELLAMTDWFTDELFSCDRATQLIFPVSRLLVDPERFSRDHEEPMAAVGMGAVYTRTHQGTPLKNGRDRSRLMEAYYQPHHQKLQSWTDDAIARHGHCLIVDCHSFPSAPLPSDLDQSPQRPDFCIGTAGMHTPPRLAQLVLQTLSREGHSVQVDAPYAGSIVPITYFNRDARVHSIMIEISRGLYMQERAGTKKDFMKWKRFMEESLAIIVEWWQAENLSGSSSPH